MSLKLFFPLGLASRTPAETEEQDAEKMRQFYVAMTRAKKRVYACMAKGAKVAANGTASPMELWSLKLTSPLENLGFTVSEEGRSFLPHQEKEAPTLVEPPLLDLAFPPRRLLSFSALAKKTVHMPEQAPLLPAGSETGIVFHALLETIIERRLFSPFEREKVTGLIEKTTLATYGDEVLAILQATFTTPLGSFSLQDIPPEQLLAEVEFLYPKEGDMFKGFIDLIFEWEGKYYVLDWKTNDLGGDYSQERLTRAMHDGDYFFQAELYSKAVEKYLALSEERSFDQIFGGVYYLFLRGLPEGKGVHFHQPQQGAVCSGL